ncbi:hypothetical protein LTR08_000832 [Meristemomyces frigidus]|nr:hypothetical protein LTR08_000832 [Meristemomyces frigidus]
MPLYGNGCYNDDGSSYGCNSSWNSWARWLVLALIILGVIFVFFLFSCITARRRRRMGYSPYRGTGWSLGRTPPGHAPAQYNNNAAPQYAPQTENTHQPYYNNSNNPAPAPPAYGAANDYYGGRANDVELQQPANSYQPPKEPPPGRY